MFFTFTSQQQHSTAKALVLHNNLRLNTLIFVAISFNLLRRHQVDPVPYCTSRMLGWVETELLTELPSLRQT